MRTAVTTLEATELAIGKGWLAALSELIKARLTLLVLLTTWVGFYLGSGQEMNLFSMIHTISGAGLLAAGAAILNQVMERDFDRLMRRTSQRPIPSGQISPGAALMLGVFASLGGLAWLLFGVHALAACLGAITLGTYVFIYTPLKRVTEFNTIVGAVPGALPPLLGWCAASGDWGAPGWALFAILFFWQLPHFMAISWMYRRDYAQAGFRMISGHDEDGSRTAGSAVRNTLALLVVSLFPYALGMDGLLYLTGAVILGGGFLFSAIRFALNRSDRLARQLFFASILYLPLLLALLVADRRTVGTGSSKSNGFSPPSHVHP